MEHSTRVPILPLTIYVIAKICDLAESPCGVRARGILPV
jgi:hypothetical protein